MTLTGVTFFNTFIYGALQFTSTTNVSVLEASIPVVTVIMSAFLLGEKIRGMQWIGVLISLMGAVWVVLDGRLFQLAAIDWNVGDLIMLRSEEHTSELQSRFDLVCRLLLEKKKIIRISNDIIVIILA